MMRNLRLIGTLLSTAVKVELENRTHLLAEVANSLLRLAVALAVLSTMFGYSDSMGSWSYAELLALTGVFMIFDSLIDMFLYSSMSRFSELVSTGSIDYVLLMPCSSQLLLTCQSVKIWRCVEIVLGIFLVLWASRSAGTLGVFEGILAVVTVTSAVAILYASWWITALLAFSYASASGLHEVFYSFFSTGRFPTSVYPGWFQFALTYLIPIGFVTTVPTLAILGRIALIDAIMATTAAAILLGLNKALWHVAVRRYSGSGG